MGKCVVAGVDHLVLGLGDAKGVVEHLAASVVTRDLGRGDQAAGAVVDPGRADSEGAGDQDGGGDEHGRTAPEEGEGSPAPGNHCSEPVVE